MGTQSLHSTPTSRAARLAGALGASLLALAAAGCGDFSGAADSGKSTPTSGPGTVFDPTNVPGSREAFETTLYPLLTQYCVNCHANGPGSPQFATPVSGTAYTEILAQNKVNLADPGSSRIVRKLIDEQHNCWSDCTTDANMLEAAVQAWADAIHFGQGGVSIGETLSSTSLTLADGTEDTSVQRYDTDIIARWDFKEGAGAVAFDTSGVQPSIDLALQGGVTWLTAWGVNIDTGIVQGMSGNRKLYDRIADPKTGSGQYSVEAWITNASTALEGPARIITYSADTGARNFTLGQVMYQYDFRNRGVSPDVSGNGTPSLITYDADQDLQDRLQHVVITYDALRGRRINVDGKWTEDVDPVSPPPRLWNWDRNFTFALGNEITQDRQWKGQVRFVAVYDRALTDAQIVQNFNAGVGKRISMSFDVSHWAGPGSSIEFQVSEFDNASYMFCNPIFHTPQPSGYELAHVRIAVNGTLAPTGQGFVTLDTPITDTRTVLSQRCTVIPKGPDPATDEFNIVFEDLGGFQNVITEPVPPPAVVQLDPTARPTYGVRDYGRIRESMASVTGVSALVPEIDAAYQDLEQQLPSTFDVRSFVSSQQVGISKLALEFCDALVESAPLRTTFFGSFPFTTEPVAVFGAAATPNTVNRNQIADALYNHMVGSGLTVQPSLTDTRSDLSGLVDTLVASCLGTPCDAQRTQAIVMGECTAVLASAAVSMH